MHKSGYVSIIGNPNVGKSTLMNRLVGERLSIVTSKAQTTRHRILGIVDTPEHQIVYSDTPGYLTPAYALQEAMQAKVEETFEDTDVFLYLTDVVEKADKHKELIDKVAQQPMPVIVLINKIDLIDQSKLETLVAQWHALLPMAQIMPISALHNFGVNLIEPAILELLPEGPKFFPPDTLTNRPVRFFITEIIREKILLHCKQEVPYSVEVRIRSYKEGASLDHIEAVIYVARDSQKGILIGRGGRMLKRIGMEARHDIEVFLEKHVFLKLLVQVAEDWRNDEDELREFGYIE